MSFKFVPRPRYQLCFLLYHCLQYTIRVAYSRRIAKTTVAKTPIFSMMTCFITKTINQKCTVIFTFTWSVFSRRTGIWQMPSTNPHYKIVVASYALLAAISSNWKHRVELHETSGKLHKDKTTMYIRSYQTTLVRAKCANDTFFLDKEKNHVLITLANECLYLIAWVRWQEKQSKDKRKLQGAMMPWPVNMWN